MVNRLGLDRSHVSVVCDRVTARRSLLRSVVTRRGALVLGTALTLPILSGCATHPSQPQAAHDAAQDTNADAQTAAATSTPAPQTSVATTTAPAGSTSAHDELLTYLRAHLPKGGSVEAKASDDGSTAHLSHTVTAGETYPTIAAAYLELTEIYAQRELEKRLEKQNGPLTVGAKIEIPSPLKSAPRDPKEEKLGWPEDRALRAVFSTGPFTQTKWVELLDKLAARGLNAVILDAKDYMGPVNYPTKAKIALETGAASKPSIPNLARAIRFAHQRGIRIILRIPCFHDPMTDKKLKDGRLSLVHPTSGRPIHIDWLDPTNLEAQDYAIEIAKEGIEAGADEINLDYVRFPVHIGPSVAKLPDPKDRSNVIRDFVRRVHDVTKPAGVMLSLDLFGVTATGERSDIERLGQDIATVGPEAEVIMPMVYPSHYDKGYNGWEKPGDHPEIVGIGTKGAVAQLAKAKSANGTVVRSWLQAFAWRTSVYGAKYVVDQAKSAESNGGVGWAMWSPGCEYSAVWNGFPVIDGSKDKPKEPTKAPPTKAAPAKSPVASTTTTKTSAPSSASKPGTKKGGVATQ